MDSTKGYTILLLQSQNNAQSCYLRAISGQLQPFFQVSILSDTIISSLFY